MRVLVTGANGQVGRELLRAAWPKATEVVGLSRPEFDITSADAIGAAVAGTSPDIVINAAAYTAVDKAESDMATAFAVNDYGPSLLAAAAYRHGVPLIHLSTDYVFDGSLARPYAESDVVVPINAYGRSKAAGEASVRLRQPRHMILRTSWVYASHGQNFVRTMLRLAAERDEVSVVSDQRGTPTAAASLARVLVAMSERIEADNRAGRDAPWGTYHFTDEGETSWHGFASRIFDQLQARGLRRPHAKAITAEQYPTQARRPANSRLDCSLIERTFEITRRPWQHYLDAVLDELLDSQAQAGGKRGSTR